MPLPMPSRTSPAITAAVPCTPTTTPIPSAISANTPAVVQAAGRRAASAANTARPGIWEIPISPTAKAANGAL